MPSPILSRVSLAVAFVTVLGVASAYTVGGGRIFSPGALHAGDGAGRVLGGVASHAALGGTCASCHAPPFSDSTMVVRCTQCHTDIQEEQRDSTSLHGALREVRDCTACHTEHRGAAGEITRGVGLREVHARFGFPLDGAHAQTECASCHLARDGRTSYADAPSTCVGCHEKDDTHRGGFGPDCAACHTTSTWEGATFAHDVFPIDHGARRASSCETCHTDKSDYKKYTCYGCHAHTPANVLREHQGEVDTSDLSDCVACHRGGRGEGERREGGEGGRRRRN